LAEANKNLALALEYAKRAVNDESIASHQANLSQLRAEDLEPTRGLAPYWDTLGWVYFKIGDLDQAERYLNAAWVLSQIAVMADHLGQVYEHQNKKQAAVRMYRFALNRASVQGSRTTELVGKIRERLDRLSPGTTIGDLHNDMEITNEVSHMRTVKLPLVVTGDATAEFFVVLAQDQKSSSVVVEDVRFISGSESLKPADTALRSVNFKIPLPADGRPRLLRRGILFCSAHSGCSFTLLNPQDVHSVN
jgi:tetratricopeptide (TPR) repeat protein